MERAGVIRTLAEPTLTAISGESATFLAGGEFPIPGGAITCARPRARSSTQCRIACPSIEFKKFGVSMQFTPVVLGAGKISLKVMTEVSDLSSDNSITLNQLRLEYDASRSPRSACAAPTPRVEIPSGGALAMAGMIQEQTLRRSTACPV